MPETGKHHIERNTVQETLVIPLYGRKLCGQLFPSLYRDPFAEELCAQLDYDFSALDRKAAGFLYRYGALEAAMRQIDIMAEIRDYLHDHPNATIVNLGCGLDQTCQACDNGTVSKINMDLPDVIEVRKRLLGTGDRERNVSCDLNDLSWLDGIRADNGVVLFAAGVFHYFTQSQVERIVRGIGQGLPGSRLIFDTVGKTLSRMMLGTTLKSAGINAVDGPFHLAAPERELGEWVPGARVRSRGYMLGYHDMRASGVSALHRGLARLCDGPFKMRVNSIDFP
ncbi:MAG: class I SAM-dependent methyltransferase [Collinsella sp.]|nr:class I SAM-dependent methyltransferase [Collinsella sp.]